MLQTYQKIITYFYMRTELDWICSSDFDGICVVFYVICFLLFPLFSGCVDRHYSIKRNWLLEPNSSPIHMCSDWPWKGTRCLTLLPVILASSQGSLSFTTRIPGCSLNQDPVRSFSHFCPWKCSPKGVAPQTWLV